MTELRQRTPRVRDEAFLRYVRTLPCTACGHAPPSQAAHIRFSDAATGNLNPGVGAKPSDSRAVPLCSGCHLDDNDAQHRVGERKFWARVGKNPYEIAASLYATFEQSKRNSRHSQLDESRG